MTTEPRRRALNGVKRGGVTVPAVRPSARRALRAAALQHGDAAANTTADAPAAAPAAAAPSGATVSAAASSNAVVRPPSEPARLAAPGADELVEVGVVGQAFGVKGGIKVFPHSTGGDALLAAPRWWLSAGAQTRVFDVLESKQHSLAVTARLAGCDDRDAAEALKGWRIAVRRADFPAPDDGEFYWVDLIGLDVFNLAGDALGTVLGLIDNGAHSILRVAPPCAAEPAAVTATAATPGKAKRDAVPDERLIPFVAAYVQHVDLAGRRIVVDWHNDY